MAVLTNRGKRLVHSYAFRYQHPDGSGLPPGLSSPTPVNFWRAEFSGADVSLWCHFVLQTYFTAGINPDDGTVGELHARVANCVVGRNAHTTATPWYTGNFLKMGAPWPAPSVEDDGDDSALGTLPPVIITMGTGPNYASFAGSPIGGWILTTGNSLVDANEVVGIFEFTSGTIAPTSAGQIVTITNQALTIAES